jgi:hypothetical protein
MSGKEIKRGRLARRAWSVAGTFIKQDTILSKLKVDSAFPASPFGLPVAVVSLRSAELRTEGATGAMPSGEDAVHSVAATIGKARYNEPHLTDWIIRFPLGGRVARIYAFDIHPLPRVKDRVFPHVPKSTKSLQLGDFWAIPLDGGQFACGRVLAFDNSTGKQYLRMFLAGLLGWVSDASPTFDSIAGSQPVIQGGAHIRTILATGGSILGNRPLELDGITPALALCSAGGSYCRVMRGFEVVRSATKQDIESLPVFQSFGFMVMRNYANAKLRRNPWFGML